MAGVLRQLYTCFTGKSRIHIDWRKSFRKLAPTGIAAGIDVGFSNWVNTKIILKSLKTFSLNTSFNFRVSRSSRYHCGFESLDK